MTRRYICTLTSRLLLLLLFNPTSTFPLRHRLVKRPYSSDESMSGDEDIDSSHMVGYQDPICSSAAFGRITDATACDAARYPPLTDPATVTRPVPIQFGPPGSEDTEVETPLYIAGGRPENQCVIAILNSPDVNTPDRALWFAVLSAATAVFNICVLGRGVGGYVPGEGFDSNIAIAIFNWQGAETGRDNYPPAIDLQHRLDTAVWFPESGSNPTQQQSQNRGSLEEPARKKHRACQAGETEYVSDAGSCCLGFGFRNLGFGDRAWLFGMDVMRKVAEVGICLMDKASV
ncbi:MAG: hypothetical protein M1836_005475 [Candelina mexicana]|nr:MAG: hypothetical protein M1836_005475 [Candelina mexicana]